MTGAPTLAARPIIVGTDHRTSPLGLRDRLFVEDAEVAGLLERLRAAGIEQAIMLSTCDRVAVIAMVADPEGAADQVRQVLARRAGMEPGELVAALGERVGEAAVRHLFAVCAALESQVIGEPQVLGQVKACHRLARAAGMPAGPLEPLMQAAYGAAKRVRSETTIGERPVSIASAAVRVARDLHGDLGRCGGVLIGAGDMGELVARAFVEAGLGRLTAVHPRRPRADAMARALACHLADFEGLAGLLPEADVILCALNAREYVLGQDMLRAALKARRHRPVLLIDTGVPGDVEPAVDRLDEAFLYDLADLERVAMDGMAGREADARAAWRIVDEEVAAYLRGQAERSAAPLVADLRALFEAERRRAVEEAPGNAERATQLLVGRLLHGPSEALRAAAAETGGDLEALERALARLYGLNGNGRKEP